MLIFTFCRMSIPHFRSQLNFYSTARFSIPKGASWYHRHSRLYVQCIYIQCDCRGDARNIHTELTSRNRRNGSRSSDTGTTHRSEIERHEADDRLRAHLHTRVNISYLSFLEIPTSDYPYKELFSAAEIILLH